MYHDVSSQNIREIYTGGSSKNKKKERGAKWYDSECVKQWKKFKETETLN